MNQDAFVCRGLSVVRISDPRSDTAEVAYWAGVIIGVSLDGREPVPPELVRRGCRFGGRSVQPMRSMGQQERLFAVAHHGQRYIAQHIAGHQRSTAVAHDDEVAATLFGLLLDGCDHGAVARLSR